MPTTKIELRRQTNRFILLTSNDPELSESQLGSSQRLRELGFGPVEIWARQDIAGVNVPRFRLVLEVDEDIQCAVTGKVTKGSQ